jgi:hypothetical protein
MTRLRTPFRVEGDADRKPTTGAHRPLVRHHDATEPSQ